MATHIMTADAAVDLITAFQTAGADVTIGGGWAVDALLGAQTRVHSDLDLWVPLEGFEALIATLVSTGIDRLFVWGDDRPWNFVVHDSGERRVDLHVYERVDATTVHYGGALAGEQFPAAHLRGRGAIAGTPVQCETAEWALECHTGYPPRPTDHDDVRRLCERFGLEVPADYAS